MGERKTVTMDDFVVCKGCGCLVFRDLFDQHARERRCWITAPLQTGREPDENGSRFEPCAIGWVPLRLVPPEGADRLRGPTPLPGR